MRTRRTGGEEWLGLHLWVAKGTPVRPKKDTTRLPETHRLVCVTLKDHRAGALWVGPRRRIPLKTRLHFGIEPVRLAYTFAYTRLPARQIVPVTVVTKIANAVPIFLFVC
jgi:hypothetical protein